MDLNSVKPWYQGSQMVILTAQDCSVNLPELDMRDVGKMQLGSDQ
jgi:hypothetical protein